MIHEGGRISCTRYLALCEAADLLGPAWTGMAHIEYTLLAYGWSLLSLGMMYIVAWIRSAGC